MKFEGDFFNYLTVTGKGRVALISAVSTNQMIKITVKLTSIVVDKHSCPFLMFLLRYPIY